MEIQKAVIDTIVNGGDKVSDGMAIGKKTENTETEHNKPKPLTINDLASNGSSEYRRAKMISKTKIFVVNAIAIHGDKFTYHNVSYINNATKISITCRKHGDFLQNPNNHLAGQGCRTCSNLGRVIPQKDFIERVTLKHGGKYTYDNVIYVNSGSKISITCRKHGDFLQTPNNHLAGHGCRKCSDLNTIFKRKLKADIKQQLSLS